MEIPNKGNDLQMADPASQLWTIPKLPGDPWPWPSQALQALHGAEDWMPPETPLNLPGAMALDNTRQPGRLLTPQGATGHPIIGGESPAISSGLNMFKLDMIQFN